MAVTATHTFLNKGLRYLGEHLLQETELVVPRASRDLKIPRASKTCREMHLGICRSVCHSYMNVFGNVLAHIQAAENFDHSGEAVLQFKFLSGGTLIAPRALQIYQFMFYRGKPKYTAFYSRMVIDDRDVGRETRVVRLRDDVLKRATIKNDCDDGLHLLTLAALPVAEVSA